ncbi:MAG: hypothetical protein ACI82F_000873 [Planctomycetota bacterium]|jgi:hypothetical protein
MTSTQDSKGLRALLVAPLAAAALFTGAAIPSAQSIQTLLLTGDAIPGAPGTLLTISDLSVTDDGQWIVRVAMSQATGSVEAAILNGAAVLLAGDVLFDPPGVAVTRFDEIDISADGALWWNIDTDASTSTDEIMYRNLAMLGREDSLLVDPNASLNTKWEDFDGFQVSSSGNLLILGDIDDPTISGNSEGALILQTFDAFGIMASETVLIKEGDFLQGTFDLVTDVGTNSGAHDIGISDSHWIAYVKNSGGTTKDEGIVVDGQLVAREADLGPTSSTFWGNLSNNAVDINNSGDYVFRGEFHTFGAPDIPGLFLNAKIHYLQGDTSPSLAPYGFASFGTQSAICLGDNGNIAFYARTTNTNTASDDCYFVNDQILVQENLTQIGTQVLGKLISGVNSLDMSNNGRYFIFEALFGDSSGGVFLIDLGLIEEMESCYSNEGILTHTDGLPILGETVTFEMDGEQDFGVTPFLMISTAPIAGWPSCGLLTPFGELLVDINPAAGNPTVLLSGDIALGPPTPISVAIPSNPAILGQDFFAQGFFWDIGDTSPAENFRLTNGLQIYLAP